MVEVTVFAFPTCFPPSSTVWRQTEPQDWRVECVTKQGLLESSLGWERSALLLWVAKWGPMELPSQLPDYLREASHQQNKGNTCGSRRGEGLKRAVMTRGI